MPLKIRLIVGIYENDANQTLKGRSLAIFSL